MDEELEQKQRRRPVCVCVRRRDGRLSREFQRRFSLNARLTNPLARPAFDALVVRTAGEQLPPESFVKTGRNLEKSSWTGGTRSGGG